MSNPVDEIVGKIEALYSAGAITGCVRDELLSIVEETLTPLLRTGEELAGEIKGIDNGGIPAVYCGITKAAALVRSRFVVPVSLPDCPFALPVELAPYRESDGSFTIRTQESGDNIYFRGDDVTLETAQFLVAAINGQAIDPCGSPDRNRHGGGWDDNNSRNIEAVSIQAGAI